MTASKCMEAQQRTTRHLVFALTTALDLLGIERPDEKAVAPASAEKLHVVVQTNSQRTRLMGTNPILWKGPIETESLAQGRLSCTGPATTWAMFSTRIPPEELVALGDSMMRRDPRIRRADTADFRNVIDSVRRYSQNDPCRVRALPGIRNMELALRLMCENTDSSQETRTRLALMRYGLDEPEVDHRLYIRRTGQTLFLDMAYPELDIVIEYDGRHHASQWLADSKRRQLLEDEGWLYVQVTSSDLGNEESERMLALRIASKIGQRIRRQVDIHQRLSFRQIADLRRLRRKPLHERHAAQYRQLICRLRQKAAFQYAARTSCRTRNQPTPPRADGKRLPKRG